MDTFHDSDSDSDFLPLKVISVGRDGKRRFDKRDRQRLIEACLQPGVSVAGMALRARVNANLLHRWICEHEKTYRGEAATQGSRDAAAFVPVPPAFVRLEIGAVQRAHPPTTQKAKLGNPSPWARSFSNRCLAFSSRWTDINRS